MAQSEPDKETQLFVLKLLSSNAAFIGCETRSDVDLMLSSVMPDWFWEKVEGLWVDRDCPLGLSLWRQWTDCERVRRQATYTTLLQREEFKIEGLGIQQSAEARFQSLELSRLKGECARVGLPVPHEIGPMFEEAKLVALLEAYNWQKGRDELAALRQRAARIRRQTH